MSVQPFKKNAGRWKKLKVLNVEDDKVTIYRNTSFPEILKKKVFWYWKGQERFLRNATYFTIEGYVDRNGEDIWVKGYDLVKSLLVLTKEGILRA